MAIFLFFSKKGETLMKKYLLSILLCINYCYTMENDTNSIVENKKKDALKKIQNVYRKYKMT